MAEPYRVTFAPRGQRDLRRLPGKIATACVEFVAGPLAENPRRPESPWSDRSRGITAPAAAVVG